MRFSDSVRAADSCVYRDAVRIVAICVSFNGSDSLVSNRSVCSGRVWGLRIVKTTRTRGPSSLR